MNLRIRITSLLASLLICASFVAAQQNVAPAPSSTPALPPSFPSQPALFPIANHIQLVIEGKVINVHDGDTITVLDPYNEKFHIRLQGIDAPELKQSFGSVSQQNLSRLVLGKQVEIYWSKVDKYRRTVGTIMLDGRDVNIEQVKAGLAWHFKKYADEQPALDRVTYAAAERSARAAVLGLWQEQAPTVPGEWRQAVKAKRWGPPPPAGTIIGNKNSMKYHRPDCTGYRDMAEKNRVFFTSVAEAEAAGYKRAGNCPAQVSTATGVTVSSGLSAGSANAAPASAAAATAVADPSETVPAAGALKDLPPTDDAVAEADETEETNNEPTATATSTAARMQAGQTNPGTAGIRPGIARTPSTIPSGSTLAQPNVRGTSASGPIIGNKNSRIYHLPWCASYNRVAEKNQVKFATIAEAENAGYKLAGNCSPKP
jgi:endonuclease YncB( thermonuclease family)/methylphosphotriester-DNA--protein-cysteine methyltransferase